MPTPQSAPVSRRVVNRAGDRRLVIVGGRAPHLRDAYYSLLAAPWWKLLLAYAAAFLVVNALFALAYTATDGIAGAESFADRFFFSVQTLATIGYGGMHPETMTANVLVTLEAMCGVLGIAVTSGLLYSKFARPRARVLFSKFCVVQRRDGVPSLVFRTANERANHVVQAQAHVVLMRNETTAEGEPIRRIHDLTLARSNSPTFVLSWTIIHPIVPGSPFHGLDAEELERTRAQVIVSLMGLDDTLMQTIHARHVYNAREILFGRKFVDILRPQANGDLEMDYRRFDEVTPE